MPVYSIGETARHFGCPPKLLTDWFYTGRLDSSRCPVFAGRRQIPANYLPTIEATLRRSGHKVSQAADDAEQFGAAVDRINAEAATLAKEVDGH